MTISPLADLGTRARRRVASRLLPFVFVLYVVNYIDRVNVSFANLRMSVDLGFSDRVYGLGVSIFYLAYHPDWLRPDDGTVLHRPFFPRTCRSELFSGTDCLFDALVLRA